MINEDSSGTISLLKAEISRLKKDLAENEKIMRTFQDGNGEGCPRCKTLFDVLDTDDTSMVRPEDEMLISFDDLSITQNDQLKKKLHNMQR